MDARYFWSPWRCLPRSPPRRTGIAGKNSFRFTGRLNGRKLKPGRYRLLATPTAGGLKGKASSTGFRIVR